MKGLIFPCRFSPIQADPTGTGLGRNWISGAPFRMRDDQARQAQAVRLCA